MTNAAYLIIKKIPWPGGQGFSSKIKISSAYWFLADFFVSLSSRSILSLGNENKTSFTFAFRSFIRIFVPEILNYKI